MRKIVFLASAQAQKPEILIRTFFDSIDPNTAKGVLLTNGYDGNVVKMAKEFGMNIILTPDSKFQDEEWVHRHLHQYGECILVSCGWPFKIPLYVINNFYTALNCHGSYLPDYRGSRAYMHYWANCSEYYGATVHYLNDRFDDGNILVRGKLKMLEKESHDDVFIRTAELCGHLLVSAVVMASNHEPGYTVSGIKRYFFKRTPEEFEQHHRENEERIANGLPIKLTPHKVLE